MKAREKALRFAFLACVFLSTAVKAQSTTTITEKQAEELAAAGAPEEMRKLPGFSLDRWIQADCPDFYYFDALWNNPSRNGSNLSGHLAVNRRTGDVWLEPWLPSPRRMTNSRLKKLQRSIRKQLAMSGTDYSELRKVLPCP